VRVGAFWQCALTQGFLQTARDATRDRAEAVFDFASKRLAHAGELLAQAAEETPEVAFASILLFAHFEEAPHACERWPRRVAETVVEAGVHVLHVEVDHLQPEVLLGCEMVIERALRDAGGLEQRADTQIVVAVAQQ